MQSLDGDAAKAPRGTELAAAAGVFVLLSAVFTYPLSVRPGRVILGDFPDYHLFVWTLGWLAHAFVSQPLAIFDANIFHPLRHTLAFSENLLGSGLIAAPVIWTTGNPLLAANVVSLSSVALCGTGAYFLARRIGLGISAAFVCGLIFAFSPARFFRIGQLHLTTVQWMPFALAYLHSYFQTERPRHLRLAVAFFSLQAITTGHGAVFLTVAIAVLVAHRIATGFPLAVMRRLRDLGLTGALLLTPAVLVAVPYKIVQHEMGLRRTLENWAATPVSYVASPARLHRAVIGLFAPPDRVTEAASAFLFPGYLPIVLALITLGAVVARGGERAWRRDAAGYLLVALVSALLIAGPPISLWPLVYWLPGFNFIRVPSRFVILTVLALAVLGGMGFEWLRGRLPLQARRWAAPLLALLLLSEFSTPIGVTPFSLRPPAAERWLADQPGPFVVAEVPNSGTPREQSTYMLHSMTHWQKTVHGFSGIDPPEHFAMYAALRSFPDAGSLERLRAFGVTLVVVHIDRYQPERWPDVDLALSRTAELEIVFQEPRSRVYRLRYDPRTSTKSPRPQ